MTLFLQASGAVLLAVVLILVLGSHGKEMGTLLGLGVCCMVALIALNYLEPVVDFLATLETLGGLDGDLVEILLKAVGIGVISEIACLVCADAGNASMGKAVQLLGMAVILWLSLPLFTALIKLLQGILGEL